MPAVNVSTEGKERIERIKEQTEWEPSNREVVDKALELFEEQKIEGENDNNGDS